MTIRSKNYLNLGILFSEVLNATFLFNKQIITVFVGKKISSLKKSSGVTDDPLSNHLSNIDDVDDCDDDYLDTLDAPKQDDEWHKLESITFENSICTRISVHKKHRKNVFSRDFVFLSIFCTVVALFLKKHFG